MLIGKVRSDLELQVCALPSGKNYATELPNKVTWARFRDMGKTLGQREVCATSDQAVAQCQEALLFARPRVM